MAYFSFDRKRWALEDISTCYECAGRAGVKKHLFVNFGVLLGVVREGTFIAKDDDVDMSFNKEIPLEQQEDYVAELDKKKMFFARKRVARRPDNKQYLWFTLRKKQGRAKFCHWLGYEWENYWWWSKGGRWVKRNKFDERVWGYKDDTQGIALGLPAPLMRKLMWIKFKGIDIQIPEKYGSVLDWEYPGWPVPQSGSSRKQVVCLIDRWDNPRTWRVKTSSALL